MQSRTKKVTIAASALAVVVAGVGYYEGVTSRMGTLTARYQPNDTIHLSRQNDVIKREDITNGVCEINLKMPSPSIYNATTELKLSEFLVNTNQLASQSPASEGKVDGNIYFSKGIMH